MKNELKVWDPLVRVFHWSLVLFFVVGYVTGEEESWLHMYSGYIVAGLIIFRLIWGMIGTQYARFSNFIYSPKKIITYSKSLIDGNPEYYTGHNPLGGLMIVALLLTLSLVTYSGLKVYALEEGLGPLAADTSISLMSKAHANGDHDDEHEERHHKDKKGHSENEQDEEFWEEIHEASANFMVFLILLHIGGVLLLSRMHDESLIKAMFTGKKKSHD